jgi:outer membrane protein TolC
MYRGSFAMGPMWQVGVGVSVPLWIDRRQQNHLAEAKALADARTADQSAVALELELRTRERIAQLQAALRIARTYRESILPLDELSLESALASYQSAKLPFISVLDALNTLYGDRATLMSRLAEAAKWRVAIDEASLQPTAMGATAAMSSGSASAQTPSPATAASGGSSTSMR